MKRVKGKRAEYWREQIRLAAEHPEGVTSYCDLNGIRRQALYFWRKRLSEQEGPETLAGAFSKVEIMPVQAPKMRRLPDPKWLAEFLMALGAAQ